MYEVKWDGYRALAYLNNEKVQLSSRNRKSFNEKFYPIHKALGELKINAVLDGEIIETLNSKGFHIFICRDDGFEPATPSSRMTCDTGEPEFESNFLF